MANAHEVLILWTRQNSPILMTCSAFQQTPATKKSREVIKNLYSRFDNRSYVLQKKFLCIVHSIPGLDLERIFLPFQVHPDKLDESLTQEDRDKAYERFLAIDKAWKLLNNQETRVNLDKQLKGKGVDKTWGRPWPTLLPTLWPTGGQIFKNINKTSVRVERVSWHKIISL